MIKCEEYDCELNHEGICTEHIDNCAKDLMTEEEYIQSLNKDQV